MGTWDAGPFSNDAALDYVGGVLDSLMEPIDAFMASPQIDETFDEAFAAIAIMNEVMRVTPSRPWRNKGVLNGEPIQTAMLKCFDEQIDSIIIPGPKASDHKTNQRASLVKTLDTFLSFLKKTK